MEDQLEGGSFVDAGWLRVMPGPALWAYSYIGAAAWGKNGPVPGDLDDLALGAEKLGGLDVPLDRSAIVEGEDDESAEWEERWSLWQRCAAEHDLRLETYRDVFEFMAAVGLVERHVEDGTVWWRPAMPAPLAEDVLPLSDEERQAQTRLRWQNTFGPAEHRIISWLVDQRADGDRLQLETSIRALADTLDLDLDDARHGLACAIDSPDISAALDPEKADADQPLTISVDWQVFDSERMALRLILPDD
ncbi:MAG TPA: DUF6042 family protein [Solirubrobacterales bacterium]|jgi:hypothetical protein